MINLLLKEFLLQLINLLLINNNTTIAIIILRWACIAVEFASQPINLFPLLVIFLLQSTNNFLIYHEVFSCDIKRLTIEGFKLLCHMLILQDATSLLLRYIDAIIL